MKGLLVVLLLLVMGCQWHGPLDPSLTEETAECFDRPWLRQQPLVVFPSPNRCCEVPILPEGPVGPGDIIDIALQNNPDTRFTWFTARSAAYQVDVERSLYFPTITAAAALQLTKQTFGASAPLSAFDASNMADAGSDVPSSLNNARNAGQLGYTQTVTPSLNVSMLLLDFGGREAGICAALMALESANWTHNQMLQDVMLEALTAYYLHLQAQALYDASLEDLKDAKENLAAAEASFQVGVNTVVDVLQAKSNFVAAELNVETQKGNVSTTMGQLVKALGFPANQRIATIPLPEELPIDQFTEELDELVEVAKEERADIAALHALVQENKANVAVAWSAGQPVLTGYSNITRTNYIHDPQLNTSMSTLGLQIRYPIFQGFFYESNVRSARELVGQAQAALESTISAALLDVVTTYYAYQTAIATLKYVDEYLKFAQEAYKAALATYKAGAGTFINVLNAYATLSNARAQYAEARTGWAISLVNVAHATGTLGM